LPLKHLFYRLPYGMRRGVYALARSREYRKMQWQRRNTTTNGYTFSSFDDLRCIFVHIPKTAGVSVCRALFGNLAGAHRPIFEYQIVFRQREFDSYFKFTFVRNPWDRVHSAYRFLQAGGMNDWDAAWAREFLRPYHSFEHFVREGLGRPEVQRWIHFRPQSFFLTVPGQHHTDHLDFIGRFETLEADFKHVAAQLGLTGATLPHVNATPGAVVAADDLDAATRDTVARLYRDDVKLLGY